jgi:hypothetical protein
MAKSYTLKDMDNRAAYMTAQTKREWEYEQGNHAISHKFTSGHITLRANTKRELIDASHSFMEGFYLGSETK